MTAKKVEPGTRSIEKQIEINAPAEVVWKALTDAEELTRWFPLSAEVTPGPGGSLRWTWGEFFDWKSRIEIWEPHRHLRAVYDWSAPAEKAPGPPLRLAMDFYLEGRGGKTILRLVHSGFGASADWDNEYDAVNCGWQHELRSLRHYLERHPGIPRLAAWARARTPRPHQAAWERLMSPQGLLQRGSLENRREGDSYSITAATGEEFRGRVVVNQASRSFTGTIARLNDSLLRAEVYPPGDGGTEVSVWLLAYGLAPAEVDSFRQRYTELLQKLFP